MELRHTLRRKGNILIPTSTGHLILSQLAMAYFPTDWETSSIDHPILLFHRLIFHRLTLKLSGIDYLDILLVYTWLYVAIDLFIYALVRRRHFLVVCFVMSWDEPRIFLIVFSIVTWVSRWTLSGSDFWIGSHALPQATCLIVYLVVLILITIFLLIRVKRREVENFEKGFAEKEVGNTAIQLASPRGSKEIVRLLEGRCQ